MANIRLRIHLWNWTAAAAIMAVLVIEPSASAQMKDADLQGKGAPQELQLMELPQPKVLPLIHSGYSRPGFPNDTIQGGKVLAVALDSAYTARFMGGTVYFAVYERTSGPEFGDAFGTGMPGIDELFREGRSGEGHYSPTFDTNARFLYVYQVVNDRGLNPSKELSAGPPWRDLRTEDIVLATVKLLVDPREITSWGHFKGAAFAASAAERDLTGTEQRTADGKSVKMQPLVFSSNPSILDALRFHEYLSIAPAVSLHTLRNGFGIAPSDLNLKKSKAYQDLSDLNAKGAGLIQWQRNMLAAGNGGIEPSFVQIQFAHYNDMHSGYPFDFDGSPMLLPVGKNPARAYFKVNWTGDQVLKLGDHSVVFGFTSNCPPAEEAVRLISAARPGINEVMGTALVDIHGPGAGLGQVVGAGTVPTPACFCEPVSVGGGYWMGGFFGGGGGGVGGGFAGNGYGFAGPGAALIGGGGNGGGGGSQDQSQSQEQKQKQKQEQDQDRDKHHGGGHDCCGDGNVVPEPATIALGLLGLPALYVMVRKRRGAVQPI